jgi:hypothetical protein
MHVIPVMKIYWRMYEESGKGWMDGWRKVTWKKKEGSQPGTFSFTSTMVINIVMDLSNSLLPAPSSFLLHFYFILLLLCIRLGKGYKIK